MPLESIGTVRATDVNDYEATQLEVRAGDIVERSRQGRRGSIRCRVLGFAPGTERALHLQPVTREGVDEGRTFAVGPHVSKVFRDGVRVGIPAPFESTVISYEFDPAANWGWVSVLRPGFRPVEFNNRCPGWPTTPLMAGQRVTVSARQLPGDLHVTFFVAAIG